MVGATIARKVTTLPRERIWEISTLGPAGRAGPPGSAREPVQTGPVGRAGPPYMNHGAARRVLCGDHFNPARHGRPGWACRAKYTKWRGPPGGVREPVQSGPARSARLGVPRQIYENGAARRVVCGKQSKPARHDTALHLPARPGRSAHGSVRHVANGD
jgi:hypothetical protein